MDSLVAVADTVVACTSKEAVAFVAGGMFLAGVVLVIVVMKLKEKGYIFGKKA